MKTIITILVGSIVWKLIIEFNHDNLELNSKDAYRFYSIINHGNRSSFPVNANP